MSAPTISGVKRSRLRRTVSNVGLVVAVCLLLLAPGLGDRHRAKT